MSIIFEWKREELDNLLSSCEEHDALPLILKYLSKEDKILEAGCGAGRWVKYFHDLDWDITGLEISPETVQMVNDYWPELTILQGDIANPPFRDESFDGLISLGAVEHCSEGPTKSLNALFNVLKKGGVAIITVPCLNKIRVAKRFLWLNEIIAFIRICLRFALKRKPTPLTIHRLSKKYKYPVKWAIGEFFEYRMTPGEFSKEVQSAGFEIIEHLPIQHIDGIYHDLNPFKLLVHYRHHRFIVSPLARFVNKIFLKIPFFHCHTQAIVARKP